MGMCAGAVVVGPGKDRVGGFLVLLEEALKAVMCMKECVQGQIGCSVFCMECIRSCLRY